MDKQMTKAEALAIISRESWTMRRDCEFFIAMDVYYDTPPNSPLSHENRPSHDENCPLRAN